MTKGMILKMDTGLNMAAEEVHRNAVAHGWWENPRNFGEIIALCHAELSEALEEYRDGRKPDEVYFKGDKPEGIPIELADVIIRILDFCGRNKVDIDSALQIKHNYNLSRPYRHGGKVI